MFVFVLLRGKKGRYVRVATPKWAAIDPPRKIPRCGCQEGQSVYTVEEDGLGKTIGKVLPKKHWNKNKVSVLMYVCMCPYA